MTNAESKQQYEGAILNQLIKNSERLVTVESQVSDVKVQIVDVKAQIVDVKSQVADVKQKTDFIYKSLKWIIGLLGAIFIAVLANLLSQPFLGLFG